jgi:hypothetical protein
MLVAYSLSAAVIAGISSYAIFTERRIWYFTDDPFVLGNLPFYAGILSNLGILLWCAGAAICFFSYAVLGREASVRNVRRFLFLSALLTILLLADDLFQMHRIFYLKYIHLTTDFVYGVYGLLVLGYLFLFKRQILETEFLLLLLALIFFVMAVIVDVFSILPRGNTAASDGLKFFGIVSWFIYFTRTCWKILTGQVE